MEPLVVIFQDRISKFSINSSSKNQYLIFIHFYIQMCVRDRMVRSPLQEKVFRLQHSKFERTLWPRCMREQAWNTARLHLHLWSSTTNHLTPSKFFSLTDYFPRAGNPKVLIQLASRTWTNALEIIDRAPWIPGLLVETRLEHSSAIPVHEATRETGIIAPT